MGGPGSGNWWRRKRKKATVEDSLVIGVKDVRIRQFSGEIGSLTWTRANGSRPSIGYSVTGRPDRPTVHLHYRRADKEDLNIPVHLETTPTQFGGRRWWFVCPLIVGGMACNRRSGKLYLPPGAKYFGCRKCHGLTYRSCQQAHQSERLFSQLGLDGRVAKLWQRIHRGK